MFKKIVIVFLFILVLFISFTFLYIKFLYFPDFNGTLNVKGINDEIKIYRDTYGIPHIIANNFGDALFGQGFVEGQDRPFQIELYRRIIDGTLSEAGGENLLEYDIFSKTLGFKRHAKILTRNLPPEEYKLAKAFTDGINEGIKSLGNRLPLEFLLLGIKPGLWEPEDPIAFALFIAWGLSSNYESEYIMLKIKEKLGEEKAAELIPYNYPFKKTTFAPLPFAPSFEKLLSFLAMTQNGFEGLFGLNLGCSNWVISPSKSNSGKAMLAYDAHQGNPVIPGSVYLLHLKVGTEIDVAGGAIVGIPAFYAGRNKNIAWGMTNLEGDCQDLIIEKISPDDADYYFHKNKYIKMDVRKEKICYKEKLFPAKMKCKTFKMRETINGPVISDLLNDKDNVISIRWTGFRPENRFTGYIKMSLAKNWKEFREALADFDSASQHFAYADAQGNIGYQIAGMIPERKKSASTFPVDLNILVSKENVGADSDTSSNFDPDYELDDWKNLLTLDQLPHYLNPDVGFIANANNRPEENLQPYYLGIEFLPPQRRNRLVVLLTEKKKFTRQDMMKQRSDILSLLPSDFFKLIKDDIPKLRKNKNFWIIESLLKWNNKMDKDKIEPLLFHSFFYQTLIKTLQDELGDDLLSNYLRRQSLYLERFLFILEDENNHWFDDINTKGIVESRKDVLWRALDNTTKFIEQKLGKNKKNWKWGKLHMIHFKHYMHNPLKFLSKGPYEYSGDCHTIDRGAFAYSAPFNVQTYAVLRTLVDFADKDHIWAIVTIGQSGWWLHRNYADQIPIYLKSDLIKIPMELEEIQSTCPHLLILKPNLPPKNLPQSLIK